MGEAAAGPAGHRGGRVGRAGAQRLLEVAGHGPGDHGGVPLGDQQAERAAGAEHPRHRGQRGGGVVDDLEDAVAQHHVGAVGADHVEQAGQVALLAGDRDAVLAGPAVEGGQGVGAGVDHGDPVAEPGRPGPRSRRCRRRCRGRRRGSPLAGPALERRPTPRRCGCCRGARWVARGGCGMGASLEAASGVVLIRRSRGCGATACGRRPWCPRRPA